MVKVAGGYRHQGEIFMVDKETGEMRVVDLKTYADMSEEETDACDVFLSRTQAQARSAAIKGRS